MLGLRIGEGPGTKGCSDPWNLEKAASGFSPGASKRNRPRGHRDFSTVRPISELKGDEFVLLSAS